jgi:hypothetical protein
MVPSELVLFPEPKQYRNLSPYYEVVQVSHQEKHG